MAKTLGSVPLPATLAWRDRLDWDPPLLEVVRTLDGGMTLFANTRLGGRPITLEAGEESAWLAEATALAIQSLAARTGEVFLLDWEGTSRNVVFRHQDEPAVSLAPIWPGADWYVGVIRLMEV